MTIRELNKSNVNEILRLYDKNFSDGWTESMLNGGFDGGRLFAIGAFDEKDCLVGIVTFSLSIDDADIEGIVVDNASRRLGVGELLLAKAHECIAKKGIKAVLLEVRESNVPAISLYEKFGYERISVRKKYYSDGENALVYKREF